MDQKKNVWISTEDLTRDGAFIEQEEKEFFDIPLFNDLSKERVVEELSGSSNRRDFLKYLGFSLGAATIAAACETPIRKAIPYSQKPDAIVPGVPTYYASSFVRGSEFCPVVVKTREGRPIKIEGNRLSPITRGGTSARAQASVLDLYDGSRLKHPAKKSDSSGSWIAMDWESLDNEIRGSLHENAEIRVVTHTDMGFTSKRILEDFKSVFPNTKVITYDPISSSAILLANEKNFGIRAIPSYRFDKADVIVNFGADFLATWISPVEFAKQFSDRRKIKGVDGQKINRLVQFESNMSYTGSNADHRIQIKPSEQGLAVAKLYNHIAKYRGGSPVTVSGDLSDQRAEQALQRVADDLNQAGSSLVVSGSNQTIVQVLVNAVNHLLGNYNNTVDLKNPSFQKQGIDADFNSFVAELKSGIIDVVIFLGDANPVFDHPKGREVESDIKSADIVISCGNHSNETQEVCNYICPGPHYLETWNDLHPKAGYYCIIQPTIHPLFDTRPYEESLMAWTGHSGTDESNSSYYLHMQKNWEENLFPRVGDRYESFRQFWDVALHNGFIVIPEQGIADPVFSFEVTDVRDEVTRTASSGLEISFYEPLGVGAGQFGNNPWLQELPDPVTRHVWDNAVHIPVKWNGRDAFEYFNDLMEDGWLVDLTVGNETLRLPIVRQFGQMEETISVALGYGRWSAGKVGSGVGKNCFPMLLNTDSDGNIQYFATGVQLSDRVGVDRRFASVQHHHTLGLRGPDDSEGGKIINVDEKVVMTLGTGIQGGLTKRSILRYADRDKLPEAVEDLKRERAHHQHLNEQTLYPDRSEFYGMGHHWGMSVDLSACIGCGACQVACVAENNVPVVGKVEVNRHHEMTWLRIDRYYYGDVENPSVVYQPMMCQHCDNAPCENVCPVSATNHSSEGINQMAYNRCVGTRYCANNCPYKVRRFNWLDYTAADTFPANEPNPFDDEVPFYGDNLIRMVLNPDVTVRSRGVMEKCSMCVQRIQAGKLTAKSEGRKLKDGEVQSACQMACPTGAIVFGDMNDEDSRVSQLLDDPKNYFILEEVNTRPSVGYLMKVTNKNKEIDGSES